MWLRVVNGLSLIITASSKYSISSTLIGAQNRTSTLVVFSTSSDDATSYICQADNTAGSTDASATLAVQGISYVACRFIALLLTLYWSQEVFKCACFPTVPPVISVPLMDQTSVQPNTAMFTCTATGLPRPSFQWTRTIGNTQVTLTNSSQLVISETNVGDRQITSVLTLAQTSTSNTANYTCTAQNTAGSDSSTASLNVYGECVTV